MNKLRNEPPLHRVQLRMRAYRGEDIAVGPGKIALLQAIAHTHSISAAARELGMSYRRAWLLVDALNRSLREPAVATSTGGARGGGSVVTPSGLALIQCYRAIETTAATAAAAHIEALKRMLAP
ncbi:winged helix-turn-helix domain-containing protein [Bordetella sp. FB-8]|uniref:winged helix-turn-helix domain-containing protein n=1 Tax=Bordetella sp. FB-8 TaxID=1159870 RepID=UPI0003663785|nr:LysR family transcriptional regulator [Bordetella sp. FB-8]